MIKKIILGISILFSISTFAQEGTASPYSFYGIGDVRFKGTAENRAMGGLGVIQDSVRINLQNPASYSFLRFTSFAVGGANTRLNFKTNSQNEEAQRTTLDYLAIGLPVGNNAGVAFGLIPQTTVGYKIRNDYSAEDPYYRFFTGEGGVNRVFLGGAYKIHKDLSFGVDLQYNFGKVKTETIVADPYVFLGSRARNESTYSGFSTNLGLMHKTKLNKKWDWQNSLTFTPESKLSVENTRNVAVVLYDVDNGETVYGQEDVIRADGKYTIASKFSLGSSFGIDKKWMIGAEYTFSGKNSNAMPAGVSTEAAGKLSLGGYFIPKYNSYSGYFKRVTYRAGYKYENTGLVINNKTIVDHCGTLGFSFPVGTSISSLNLGLEYGKRGTRANGLIEENYFGISLGLSFSDRWFMKTKYD